MTKLLIIGGNGMAGHVITRHFEGLPGYEVRYTSRDEADPRRIHLDVRDQQALERVIREERPDLVINCVALLNEYAREQELDAFIINSLLPHQLRTMVERIGGKLIHISTDCVFLGDRGDYSEQDLPDWTTVYAKTKALGEVISDRHLTVRTSIIGPEIRPSGIGLFGWFMQQQGEVKGYRRVLWNGVTTIVLARALEEMIHQELTGLVHLSSPQKISKYELLKVFQEEFGREDIRIHPDDAIVQDRSLVSLRQDFHFPVPGYAEMVREMREWIDRERK